MVPPQVIFSPNGQHIAVVHEDGQVGGLQLRTGHTWVVNPLGGRARSNESSWKVAIAFSPDSQRLVTSGFHLSQSSFPYLVTIRDSSTGQELDKRQGHTNPINAIQFSPDGLLIATACEDSSVRLWMAGSGGELPTIKLTNKPFYWAAFQDSERSLEMMSYPRPEQASLPGHNSVATHQTGVWTVTNSGTFYYWDVDSPSPDQARLDTEDEVSRTQAFLPFQRFRLFSGLKRLGSTLWSSKEVAPNLEARPMALTPQQADRPSGDPSAKSVSTTGDRNQKMSRVVSLANQELSGAQLTGATVNSNGTLFAIATSAGLAEIWQATSNQAITRVHRLQTTSSDSSQAEQALEAARVSISRLTFSRDGQKLLGVGSDKVLRLWDVGSGKLLHELAGHESLVEQARFSPNDKQIISASWDQTARIWDVETGNLVRTLTHTDVITSAKFSPNGQQILITSLDGTAQLLDAATGTTKVILAGHHRGAVLDGDFSPDGQLLVTASIDGTAGLWDAATGTVRTILRTAHYGKPQESIKQVFFSPDGQSVATLGQNGTLHLWAATWQRLLTLARDRSLRQLSTEECLRYLRLPPKACPALGLKSDTES